MTNKNNNDSLEETLARITAAINAGHYNDAFRLYSEVFSLWPEYLSPATSVPLTKSQATHIHNVGNLARRDLFVKTQSIGSSDRIKRAVAIFVVLSKSNLIKLCNRQVFCMFQISHLRRFPM